MRAAEEDLRPPILAHHLADQAADAIVDAHHLARDLRVAPDAALGAAQTGDDPAEFDALADAGADLTDAPLALLGLGLAPGLAALRARALLRRLRLASAAPRLRRGIGRGGA